MVTASFKKRPSYVKKGQTWGPKLEDILIDVAKHYNKSIVDVKSKDMHAEFVLCRRIYCYVAWKLTNAPLREIAAVIGKDHTNVCFHRDTVANWIKVGDPAWIDQWLDYLDKTQMWGAHEKIR